MQKTIKNYMSASLLGLAFIALAPSVQAQYVTSTGSTTNRFTERTELIKKFGTASTINVGWYTGAVQSVEFRDVLARFLPLSNHFSNTFGNLAILVTDKSDEEIASDALKGELDVVYTSALQGTKLMDKGWKPVLGRTDDIKGVILSRKESRINTVADLKGKKIMANSIATVTKYVKYSLNKEKVLTDVIFVEQSIGQVDLINFLKDGAVDGIVVRDAIAEKFVTDNPGKYDISFRGAVSPGHMLFLSPKFLPKEQQMKDALLNLSPNTPENKEILAGLDGYRDSDLKPFREVSAQDLLISKEVISIVPALPVRSAF